MNNFAGRRSQPQDAVPLVRIAVIGDIHDQWDERDASALMALEVDLALFVGDFGNESVALVERVAALPLPIAVALGNHDAWYSATPWGRKKCPYDRRTEDRVQQQLEHLGSAHVGYGQRDFSDLSLGVVGGRPFSWGGPDWKYGDFYADYFGVTSMQNSCDRIVQVAQQSQWNTLIFLNHNGPAGLGWQPEDPCGKDWMPIGGDYGDPDLSQAIRTVKASGKQVALVTFGHMHHTLRHTRSYLRRRIHVDDDGTVYLNAACVPRVKEHEGVSNHHFSLVTLAAAQVVQVQSIWVSPQGAIARQECLYHHPHPAIRTIAITKAPTQGLRL